MLRRSLRVTTIAISLLVLLVGLANAHKVNVFAYAEGGTIHTESYFPDGKAVEDGVIEVFDATGRKLMEGKTDREGKFSFQVSQKEDLTIVINASMGHRNEYTIKKDEM
jgi:nickel transport protein